MPVLTRGGIRMEYRDLGLEKILREVAKTSLVTLRAGVVGPKASEHTADGRLTNAENAVIQQYGLAPTHFTSRDFLHKPFVDERTRVTSILRRAVARICRGDTAEAAMDAAGYELQHIPREAIMSGVAPANTAATVAKKGFNHPLVDHLDLYDAISHRLVRNTEDALDAGAGDYESFEIGSGA